MQTGKQERGMCEGYVHKATGMALMRRQKSRLGDNTHAQTHTHTHTQTKTHPHPQPTPHDHHTHRQTHTHTHKHTHTHTHTHTQEGSSRLRHADGMPCHQSCPQLHLPTTTRATLGCGDSRE